MRRVCRIAALMWMVCFAWSHSALAQQLRISGSVSDGSAVVPNAAVSLRDSAGATTQTTTDGVGLYSFDGLKAGPYEVTVAREGFSSAKRNLTLAGESKTANFTLQLEGLK